MNAHQSKFHRARRQRRGAITVEMAIITPVILLVFFGLWEWSRVEMVKHVSRNACFAGARFGTLPGSTLATTEAKVQEILNVYGVKDADIDSFFDIGSGASSVSVTVPLDANVTCGYAFFKGRAVIANMTLVQ